MEKNVWGQCAVPPPDPNETLSTNPRFRLKEQAYPSAPDQSALQKSNF